MVCQQGKAHTLQRTRKLGLLAENFRKQVLGLLGPSLAKVDFPEQAENIRVTTELRQGAPADQLGFCDTAGLEGLGGSLVGLLQLTGIH